MAALAAVAAVISYGDGLFLVRQAGASGHIVYLYPLLPDGLIVICLVSLYDAARMRAPRPGWATAGVLLGAVLTVAMNLAAGLARSLALALIDALVPVMFFVAVEVFIGHVRRGRGSLSPMVTGDAPATYSHPEPPGPLTTEQALAALLESASQRALHQLLGVPRSRVQAWAARVAPVAEDSRPGLVVPPGTVPAGADSPAGVLAPSASPTAPAGAGRSSSEPMLGTAPAGAAMNGEAGRE